MLKTILVHLRGTSGDVSTLAVAHALGQPFAAHLEALYIRRDIGSLVARARLAGDSQDPGAIAQAVEELQNQSAQEAAKAAGSYAAFCLTSDTAGAGLPAGPKMSNAFREASGDEVGELIKQSRGHDLLVVKGGLESAGGLSSGELSKVITSAGRPVVLAPNTARPIKTVVIAWKEVLQAARAVTAAMPVLETAEKVYVLNAEEEGQQADCELVVSQLHWHGVNAESQRVDTGDRDTGHAILEMTRAAAADLLVMGAYGHSRLTETILGGFTKSVLEDASLPVFLMH